MNNLKAGGGYMNESFKINVYFDEKGEELESLIERLLINTIIKHGKEEQCLNK